MSLSLASLLPLIAGWALGCSAEPSSTRSNGSDPALAGAGGTTSAGGASAGSAGSPIVPGGAGGVGGAAGSAGSPLPISGGAAGDMGSSGSGGQGEAGAAGEGSTLMPPGSGGPSSCEGFVFCENFEGYEDDASPINDRWTLSAGDEFLKVDGMMPARGERALHITYPVSGYRWIGTTEPFPAIGDKHYARLFVYIKEMPPATDYRHITTVFVGGSENNNLIRVFGGENAEGVGHYSPMIDMVEKSTNTMTGGGGDVGPEPRRRADDVQFAEAAWQCFEWYYDSGEKNEYKMWLDGVELPDAGWDPATATAEELRQFDFPTPTYTFLGWTEYHGQEVTWDVFLDEFVMDDERIGCDH